MRQLNTIFLWSIFVLLNLSSFGQDVTKTPILKTNLNNTKNKSTPLPYSETFDTEDALNNWVIQDNNGGNTWVYFESNIAYLYEYQQADDYLISPEFDLDSNKMYKVAYQANIPYGSTYSESFSVLLFNQVSSTTTLANFPEYIDDELEQKSEIFSVPEDGPYRIGFHVYSQPDMYRLEIDNVELAEIGNAAAPDSISDLVITAAANGQLADTIDFTAPNSTWGGQTLSEIYYIEIYRNDDDSEPTYIFNDPTPGEKLRWVDTNPVNGLNSYKFYISNSAGQGPIIQTEVYVGTDIPVAIVEPSLLKDNNTAIISWNAPTTGINNAYINPQKLTYRIVKNGTTEVASEINDTTYADNTPIEGTTQQSVFYTIYASTSAGESDGSNTNTLIFGDPYIAPFYESFTDGSITNTPWTSIWISGDEASEWRITDIDEYTEVSSQDNDGGMMTFNSYNVSEGSKSRLISPAINISSISNPVLGFWMYHLNDESEYLDALKVQVSVNNNDFIDLSDTILMAANNDGWTYYEISLVEYVDSENICLGFLGISNYGYNILIDNISIFNAATNDLQVISLTGSKRVNINEEETYSVKILNKGASATKDYTVILNYLMDSLVTLKGTNITPNQTIEFDFTVSAGLNDITTDNNFYKYFAEVVFASDEIASNNTSDTLNVTVRDPNLPKPQNLTANVKENNVSLNWETPETRPTATFEVVTDNFESYDAFAIENIGDWTLNDLDKDSTLISPMLGTYPNQGSPMAYQVLNVDSLGLNDDEIFTANSGIQYLISPASNNITNNNWLISSMLSAKAQTISFYTKQPTDLYGSERIVIWYSTTDKHPDSFTKLSEGNYIEMYYTFWYEYTFDLPEGAKYFAIQSVSEQNLYLCIDDVTFEKSDVDPEVINLEGFNIYRNDTLVTTTLATETSFEETLSKGSYNYKITAVYDKGESNYSDEVEVNTLTNLSVLKHNKVKIYAANGNIYIKNALGMSIQVISLDGKVLNHYHGDNNSIINYKHGIYIVKVNQVVKKVVVQ